MGLLKPYNATSGLKSFAAHVNRRTQALEQIRRHEQTLYRELNEYIDEGNPFDYLALVSNAIGTIELRSTRVGAAYGTPVDDAFALHVATSVCDTILAQSNRIFLDEGTANIFAKFGLDKSLLTHLTYLSKQANAEEDPKEYIYVVQQYIDKLIEQHEIEAVEEMEISMFAGILAASIQDAIIQAKKIYAIRVVKNQGMDDLANLFGRMGR